MKQFVDRGLAAAGIALIGTGDVVDDDILDAIGAPALGVVTSFHYSAAHPSPENKAYVDAFMKANNGMRPELSFGRRLRRHASHLRSGEEDRRQQRRREAASRR